MVKEEMKTAVSSVLPRTEGQNSNDTWLIDVYFRLFPTLDYKTYSISNIDDVINFQLNISSIEHMRDNLYTVYIEFHFIRQVLTPA